MCWRLPGGARAAARVGVALAGRFRAGVRPAVPRRRDARNAVATRGGAGHGRFAGPPRSRERGDGGGGSGTRRRAGRIPNGRPMHSPVPPRGRGAFHRGPGRRTGLWGDPSRRTRTRRPRPRPRTPLPGRLRPGGGVSASGGVSRRPGRGEVARGPAILPDVPVAGSFACPRRRCPSPRAGRLPSTLEAEDGSGLVLRLPQHLPGPGPLTAARPECRARGRDGRADRAARTPPAPPCRPRGGGPRTVPSPPSALASRKSLASCALRAVFPGEEGRRCARRPIDGSWGPAGPRSGRPRS